MKQHISALMDGELFDEEAEAVVDRLKRDPEAHDEWLMYHLVGDVLRQPDHVHCDISLAVRDRLQAEPTVIAPRNRAIHRARWFAVSAAASIMALSVVAWLSAKVVPQGAPQRERLPDCTPGIFSFQQCAGRGVLHSHCGRAVT